MSERQWEKKLSDFLKRAGDELRRTGEEIKTEAQKLMEEVRDPANQQKVKEILNNLGTWTERAAKEAVVAVEGAVKKAEVAFNKAVGGESKVGEEQAQGPGEANDAGGEEKAGKAEGAKVPRKRTARKPARRPAKKPTPTARKPTRTTRSRKK